MDRSSSNCQFLRWMVRPLLFGFTGPKMASWGCSTSHLPRWFTEATPPHALNYWGGSSECSSKGLVVLKWFRGGDSSSCHMSLRWVGCRSCSWAGSHRPLLILHSVSGVDLSSLGLLVLRFAEAAPLHVSCSWGGSQKPLFLTSSTLEVACQTTPLQFYGSEVVWRDRSSSYHLSLRWISSNTPPNTVSPKSEEHCQGHSSSALLCSTIFEETTKMLFTPIYLQ